MTLKVNTVENFLREEECNRHNQQLARFTNWVTSQIGHEIDCRHIFGIFIWNEAIIPIVEDLDFDKFIRVEKNRKGLLEGYLL